MGRSNAYISTENKIFRFEVAKTNFKEALDM